MSGIVVPWSKHVDINILVSNGVFETLELYMYTYILFVPVSTGGHWRPREATWGPRVTTEASSRAQILAHPREASPLTTLLGPLSLRAAADAIN